MNTHGMFEMAAFSRMQEHAGAKTRLFGEHESEKTMFHQKRLEGILDEREFDQIYKDHLKKNSKIFDEYHER